MVLLNHYNQRKGDNIVTTKKNPTRPKSSPIPPGSRTKDYRHGKYTVVHFRPSADITSGSTAHSSAFYSSALDELERANKAFEERTGSASAQIRPITVPDQPSQTRPITAPTQPAQTHPITAPPIKLSEISEEAVVVHKTEKSNTMTVVQKPVPPENQNAVSPVSPAPMPPQNEVFPIPISQALKTYDSYLEERNIKHARGVLFLVYLPLPDGNETIIHVCEPEGGVIALSDAFGNVSVYKREKMNRIAAELPNATVNKLGDTLSIGIFREVRFTTIEALHAEVEKVAEVVADGERMIRERIG